MAGLPNWTNQYREQLSDMQKQQNSSGLQGDKLPEVPKMQFPTSRSGGTSNRPGFPTPQPPTPDRRVGPYPKQPDVIDWGGSGTPFGGSGAGMGGEDFGGSGAPKPSDFANYNGEFNTKDLWNALKTKMNNKNLATQWEQGYKGAELANKRYIAEQENMARQAEYLAKYGIGDGIGEGYSYASSYIGKAKGLPSFFVGSVSEAERNLEEARQAEEEEKRKQEEESKAVDTNDTGSFALMPINPNPGWGLPQYPKSFQPLPTASGWQGIIDMITKNRSPKSVSERIGHINARQNAQHEMSPREMAQVAAQDAEAEYKRVLAGKAAMPTTPNYGDNQVKQQAIQADAQRYIANREAESKADAAKKLLEGEKYKADSQWEQVIGKRPTGTEAAQEAAMMSADAAAKRKELDDRAPWAREVKAVSVTQAKTDAAAKRKELDEKAPGERAVKEVIAPQSKADAERKLLFPQEQINNTNKTPTEKQIFDEWDSSGKYVKNSEGRWIEKEAPASPEESKATQPKDTPTSGYDNQQQEKFDNEFAEAVKRTGGFGEGDSEVAEDVKRTGGFGEGDNEFADAETKTPDASTIEGISDYNTAQAMMDAGYKQNDLGEWEGLPIAGNDEEGYGGEWYDGSPYIGKAKGLPSFAIDNAQDDGISSWFGTDASLDAKKWLDKFSGSGKDSADLQEQLADNFKKNKELGQIKNKMLSDTATEEEKAKYRENAQSSINETKELVARRGEINQKLLDNEKEDAALFALNAAVAELPKILGGVVGGRIGGAKGAALGGAGGGLLTKAIYGDYMKDGKGDYNLKDIAMDAILSGGGEKIAGSIGKWAARGETDGAKGLNFLSKLKEDITGMPITKMSQAEIKQAELAKRMADDILNGNANVIDDALDNIGAIKLAANESKNPEMIRLSKILSAADDAGKAYNPKIDIADAKTIYDELAQTIRSNGKISQAQSRFMDEYEQALTPASTITKVSNPIGIDDAVMGAVKMADTLPSVANTGATAPAKTMAEQLLNIKPPTSIAGKAWDLIKDLSPAQRVKSEVQTVAPMVTDRMRGTSNNKGLPGMGQKPKPQDNKATNTAKATNTDNATKNKPDATAGDAITNNQNIANVETPAEFAYAKRNPGGGWTFETTTDRNVVDDVLANGGKVIQTAAPKKIWQSKRTGDPIVDSVNESGALALNLLDKLRNSDMSPAQRHETILEIGKTVNAMTPFMAHLEGRDKKALLMAQKFQEIQERIKGDIEKARVKTKETINAEVFKRYLDLKALGDISGALQLPYDVLAENTEAMKDYHNAFLKNKEISKIYGEEAKSLIDSGYKPDSNPTWQRGRDGTMRYGYLFKKQGAKDLFWTPYKQ